MNYFIGHTIRILSGDIMWINKGKYEHLNRMAKDNEHDANMFRRLMNKVKANIIVSQPEFIMMSPQAFESLFKEAGMVKDRLKEIEAELEWYKVKYHEMKITNEE